MRLKTNIHTTKGLDIIRRAEKQLLNECIRSTNNQLEMFMFKRDTCSLKLKGLVDQKTMEECEKLIKNVFMFKRDTCSLKLKGLVDQKTMEECEKLIKNVIESRHKRDLERQRAKYEVLHQCKIGCSNKVYCTDKNNTNTCTEQQIHVPDSSNNTEDTKKWVINLSRTPLTENQERLLAQGPKFAIKPRWPPVEEYIAAIEKACPNLEQGEANELRVGVKKALKKSQNAPRTPSNITREAGKALHELIKDKNRIILTTDKGVALVVMNKADYISKSEELLNTTTYKKIPEDPTNRQKTQLISILKNIKAEGGLNEESYKRMFPTGAVSPKFLWAAKIHKTRHTTQAHNFQHWYSHI